MVRGVRGGRGKESNNFVNFLFFSSSSYSSSLISFIFITVSITSKWNRKVPTVLIRVVCTLQNVREFFVQSILTGFVVTTT